MTEAIDPAKPEADTPTKPDRPKPRRFTIEELVQGMTPVPSEWGQDDWPVGSNCSCCSCVTTGFVLRSGQRYTDGYWAYLEAETPVSS